MQDNDTGGLTPEQFAEAFTMSDPANLTPENTVGTPENAAKNVPDGMQISLTEAPVQAPPGTIGIQVTVDVIMDQIHQHWARQMADQIQRNAELAAALTATNDELTEVRAKLAALTEVTNSPGDDTPGRVRQIPPDEAMHHGLTD